jgi:hypothetical protein
MASRAGAYTTEEIIAKGRTWERCEAFLAGEVGAVDICTCASLEVLIRTTEARFFELAAGAQFTPAEINLQVAALASCVKGSVDRP